MSLNIPSSFIAGLPFFYIFSGICDNNVCVFVCGCVCVFMYVYVQCVYKLRIELGMCDRLEIHWGMEE